MKKIVYILGVIILVVIGVFLYLFQGPDVSQFEHLKETKISHKDTQKVLVVKAKGDPNIVGANAFKLLYSIYFKTKGTSMGPNQPAPRARWPITLETPKDQWIGLYALPVPRQTNTLPEFEPKPGLEVSLTNWEYGDVAEILHIGPYDKEVPTVNKLMDYCKKNEFDVTGVHEEEYLKGPGMFGKGNPEKYVTIIRYQVRKRELADKPTSESKNDFD